MTMTLRGRRSLRLETFQDWEFGQIKRDLDRVEIVSCSEIRARGAI